MCLIKSVDDINTHGNKIKDLFTVMLLAPIQ